MDNAKETPGEGPALPSVGKIYRDDADQSFVILSARQNQLLIEFADGRVKRISMNQWLETRPRPAVC
ncbi:MAG TPA: hypothetical protein ENK26_14435 [Gammaproteobacteria bacterium]|nr:hypothetical protein [Gammaproteobacteria bacterium]